LVVEDRPSFAPNLRKALEACGVRSAWLTHARAANEPASSYAKLDVVFLDAYDTDGQQADRTRSRLASLDVLQVIRSLPPDQRPTVVAYSTHMNRPEVNIPLREWGLVAACFEPGDLITRTCKIIAGDYEGSVPEPRTGDWARIHPRLPDGALVADAHQKARQHPRTWELIWNPDAGFDRAAQRWVTRRLLPLLRLERGYLVAVQTVQKVACLPSVFDQ
jgi:CheY-like chemotaxis protein